jgi:hypothetical protein
MPLPTVIDESQPLEADSSQATNAGASNPLACAVPDQVKDEWCWAAVAAGVQEYYEQIPAEPCKIASTILGSRCCDDPGSCDEPSHLSSALERLGLLQPPIAGQLKFSEVVQEIDSQRPLCCFIDFGRAVGHFIVISGYDATSSPSVGILDPAPNGPHDSPQFIPFASLQAGYGDGTWAETYRTQARGA